MKKQNKNTKKRSKKRYKKKRYSRKRYNKKINLKGGRLTPRQLELLRKVNTELGGRKDYCRKKNKIKNRTEQDCNDKEPVCKWDYEERRCMKDKESIRFLNAGLYVNSGDNYYPPFTELYYIKDGQRIMTTFDQIPTLKKNGDINNSTLVFVDGMRDWGELQNTSFNPHPSYFEARSHQMHLPVPEPEPVFDACQDLYASENCIVFNPETNINIVRDVLSKEAKFESNIYLHLDDAHGRIIDIDRPTILNNNFHLLLTVARGHGDRWSSVDNRGELALLSIMKRYLDNDGHNNLFDREGCMTSNGSLLFYSIMFIHEFGISTMDFIMNLINRGEKITLSKILNLISDNLLKIDTNTDNYITERMKNFFFRILKLYNPDDEINNTTFAVEKEETEKAKRLKRGSTSPYDEAKWGVTILYTNDSDENKYIHLPLNEIPRINGAILLSQILDYLKPLTELGDKLFLKHGSCRVDDEYFKCKPEYGDNGSGRRPTEYKPELSSLTRGISNPKEIAEKNCFINSFREEQRDDVRDFLRAYPTMIDYYLWLEINGKLDDYIIALMEHDEGSLGLYEFISKNYK